MTQAFQDLLQRAYQEGRKAGAAVAPHPMLVAHCDINGKLDTSQPIYRVDDGACGFAWVKVRPATTPFARWLKKNDYARQAYSGGLDIWVSEFGQSVDRKYAMASAMAKVLSEAGITAYADSRLD